MSNLASSASGPFGIDRPYKRLARPTFNVADNRRQGGVGEFVRHPAYARQGGRYLQSFQLLQDEIRALFTYVHPKASNSDTCSLRIADLYVRACGELEANFRAILRENRYQKTSAGTRKWNMHDYALVNTSHRLSGGVIDIPEWEGHGRRLRPFEAWETPDSKLPWYQRHHAVKHDRAANLDQATLGQLMEAWAGLALLLTAQFGDINLLPGLDPLYTGVTGEQGFEMAAGGYLQARLWADLDDNECYVMNWNDLENEVDPFQRFDYDQVATSPRT